MGFLSGILKLLSVFGVCVSLVYKGKMDLYWDIIGNGRPGGRKVVTSLKKGKLEAFPYPI